jgi:LytS/YehU family sensor histidine kinase
VAVVLKKRFPDEDQVSKRLTLMIFSFFIVTGVFLFSLFRGYEAIPVLDYSFNENGFIWAYMGMAIINIFLTLLHEGISRYERWKANLKETESLKKVYRQSRLQGLKSQIKPHFLLNSLNSLSCLIHEDSDEGEKFLDEMSKVYRYMLQHEEQLVQLGTELKFLESYSYLLTARHNEGLKVNISVNEEDKEKWLPPLSLQVILENVVTKNACCKEEPLDIQVYSGGDSRIIFRNNALPKLAREALDAESGIDNLVAKYRLLSQGEVKIASDEKETIISIPLIENKEEVVV